MSVRRPERLLIPVLALLSACDPSDPDPGDTTANTEAPPPIRVPPAIDAPCAVDGEFLCGESVDARLCRDGAWAQASCSKLCQDLDPPQCNLGCLITPEGHRCLCVDLGAVCE